MTGWKRLALTNVGHFTTMLVADGRVRGLSLHLDRLVDDCAVVFGTRLSREHVRERIRLATVDRPGPVTVRVTVADPAQSLHRPSAPADPQVLLTTRPAPPPDLPPLRLCSTRYARDLPAVKHTGLFGALHERRRAQLAGYDDALFVTAAGLVTEGPTWNVGFLAGDRLIWPQAEVLSGVTMRLLSAARPGPVRTEPVPLSELDEMAAVVAVNAAGIRVVTAVDARRFGPHPAVERLREAYAGVVPEVL